MKKPKVSICLPTYNGESYLSECLESIKLQSYSSIELIISDDNSTDETLTIINDFKKHFVHPIVILKHKPNGIGSNWNNAIKNSTGEYIKLVFQDDYLEPNCIEELIKYTRYKNKVYKFISCKRKILMDNSKNNVEWLKKFGNLQKGLTSDSNGNYILNKSFFKKGIIFNNPINKVGEPTSTLIHKSVFSEIGYFSEKHKQILDYEYYYKVLIKYDILIINKELVTFRLHEAQATQINAKNQVNEKELYLNSTVYIKYFYYLSIGRQTEYIIKKLKTLLKF